MLAVSQIYDWAADQLHEVSTDALLTTLLLRWVNEGLEEVARASQWKWLEAQEEFVLGNDGAGANTSLGVTYIPHRVHRLLSLWPAARGYREPIQIIGAWELDAISPSITSGTVADYLAVWGYYNVARDNPTVGTLAVADSGTPTGTQVRIEGVDNNGNEVVEDVAETGTSAAQFAAGPDGVRRIYVINSTVVAGTGIITVTRGGVQIERINVGIGERVRERLRTEISPAPTAGNNNYVVRYYRRIRPVNDNDDIVEVPFEFEALLFHAVGRRLAMYKGQADMVTYFDTMFASTVQHLKGWQNRQPGRMRGLRSIRSWPRQGGWSY